MAFKLCKGLVCNTRTTLKQFRHSQYRQYAYQAPFSEKRGIHNGKKWNRTFSDSAISFQKGPSYVKHASVDHSTISEKQLFFIGDVQGCYDELMELLDKANALNDKTVVFFVGDMLSRGPRNLDVLKFLVERSDTVFAVRGHHEDIVLTELQKLKENTDHTLKPNLQWIQDIDTKGIEYLKSLPYTISLPTLNIIVVHAGLVPGRELSQQKDNDMLRMKTLIQTGKGYLAKEISDEGSPWAAVWNGPERVIFGHDSVRGLQLHENAVGLDTGCVYGRQLTGLLLTADKAEFVTVKAHDFYVNPFG